MLPSTLTPVAHWHRRMARDCMTYAFRAPTGEVEAEAGLFLWRVEHGTPLFLGR